jgi:hypothetical protein
MGSGLGQEIDQGLELRSKETRGREDTVLWFGFEHLRYALLLFNHYVCSLADS